VSWSWLYGSWINDYLCNRCLSPLKLWVWIPHMARCTRYNFRRYSLSVTCDRSMVFSRYSWFLHQENGTPQYNRNFVESGVKHHNLNPALQKKTKQLKVSSYYTLNLWIKVVFPISLLFLHIQSTTDRVSSYYELCPCDEIEFPSSHAS
jgi:hypothetical protein